MNARSLEIAAENTVVLLQHATGPNSTAKRIMALRYDARRNWLLAKRDARKASKVYMAVPTEGYNPFDEPDDRPEWVALCKATDRQTECYQAFLKMLGPSHEVQEWRAELTR